METWEFLLQKQGTRSWLPLQTRKVSLGAGTYRLIAQGCPPKIDVEIQVFYQTLDKTNLERRSQKRVGRTSEEGLMVIVPFTDLRPGFWELHISSPQIRALWGDDWQDVIHMKVKSPNTNSLGTEPIKVDISSDAKPAIQYHSDADSVVLPPQRAAAYQPTFSLTQPKPTQLEPVTTAFASLESEPDSASWFASLPPLALVNPQQLPDSIPTEEAPAAWLTPLELESERISERIAPNEPPAESSTAALTPEILTGDDVEFEVSSVPELTTQNNQPPPEFGDNPHALLEQSIQSLEQILQQVSEPGENLIPPPTVSTPPELITERTAASPTPTELPADAFLTTPTLATVPLPGSSVPEPFSGVNPPCLSITLAQDTFIRHQDEPILISGQVELRDTLESSILDQGFAGFLHYELRDPQTQELLLAVEQPLHDATIPLVFNYLLDVPTAYATRLVLGEVRLTITQPALTTGEGDEQSLAQQTFSITAGLADLLQTVHQTPTSQLQPEPPPALKMPTAQENYPHLVQPLAKAQPTVLPPKLPQTSGTDRKMPELPSFGNPPPSAHAAVNAFSTSMVLGQKGVESDALDLGSDSFPVEPSNVDRDELMATLAARVDDTSEQGMTHKQAVGTTFSLNKNDSNQNLNPQRQREDLQQISAPQSRTEYSSEQSLIPELNLFEIDGSELAVTQLEAELTPSSLEQPDSELETASSTAQSLHFDNRFSQQLSRLAEGKTLAKPADTTAPPKQPEPLAPMPEHSSDWPLQEFVVDEDLSELREDSVPSIAPPLPTYDASGLPYPSQLQDTTAWLSPTNPPQHSALAKTSTPSSMSSSPLTTPPTPELMLPAGELVAGDLVLVKVKIPERSGLIYVKLWVKDCETRQLLDGPRAFVDFETLPTGHLETMTQIIVPLGSLAIRFEAITIDVSTGQESRKVSCDRPVVPPDFTQLNIDGFAEGVSVLPLSEH
ncbi:MAG: hypothetical protein F6J87_12365 [Spirulina sp. SIO3F2]|nr:hypothetical protein [Spirulina sp. SIO3F2]